MGSRWVAHISAAVIGFVASSGCGSDPVEPTDLAKLPPPSADAVDRAKSMPLKGQRPKFGAPPKSERPPATPLSFDPRGASAVSKG
jgi:hypothetical protein